MLKRMAVVFTLVTLAASILTGCSPSDNATAVLTDDAHSNQADPNYAVVFAQGKVNRIDIVINEGNWQAMLDDMAAKFGASRDMEGDDQEGALPDDENPQGQDAPGDTNDNPIWSECTVAFENTTWEHVGIRFKGYSSLKSSWRQGNWKLPFRLDFDQFEDDYPEINDQRFYGFKKLSLSSNWHDDSLIREKVTADIFREAGVPAPATAFYELHIDYGEGSVYFGLYTMVEVPDEPMLDTQFGNDSGNLYKPDGSGATFREGSFNKSFFQKQSNEGEADWSDIIALFEALHADTRTNDTAAWRSGLEAVFDVEGFLRWLAVNTVLQNWDTYGRMSHNYYLYNDPGDGLIHWIPWDNNMALDPSRSSLSLSFSETTSSWPLIRYLMDDAHYHKMYLSFISEFAGGIFSIDYAEELCRKAHALIEPYVVGDNGEQAGHTFVKRPEAFYKALDDLFKHVAKRNSEALYFLSGQGFKPPAIVISEIYYNPPPDLGDASYEFVEICNTGSSAIDLSGYAFTDGIEFTFPQGASIAAGEYIIVAGAADSYSGLNCQVFQWEKGNLANDGEAIQLTDAGGIQLDYVIYDDASPWPASADGNGPSLEVIDLHSTNALPTNWEASSATGGTPGQPNS